MVLNHLAAILFFSGPLLWVGLLLAVDPAGVAAFPRLLVRGLKNVERRLSGVASPPRNVEPENADLSRRVKTALRLTGVVLVLFAVAL